MAVENLTATGAATTDPIPQNGYADKVSRLCTSVEVSASASVSSTYVLARLPSSARLGGLSKLYWDDMATAGSPTLDIGAEGPSETYDDDSINDGLALSSASTGSIVIKTIDNYTKPLWEICGLSSDPNEIFTIKGKIKDAAVTTGGTLISEFVYTTN